MKKRLTLALLAVTSVFGVWAQDFKLAKNSGRLQLNLNGATVEGYNGSEIIFTSSRHQ